jgi:hypothetical protein
VFKGSVLNCYGLNFLKESMDKEELGILEAHTFFINPCEFITIKVNYGCPHD